MTSGGSRRDAMKLIIAVVQDADQRAVLDELTSRGFHATLIDGENGFLRERNASLLIGVQESYLPEVFGILHETCRAEHQFVNPLMPMAEPVDVYVGDPVTALIGGASLFMFDVARYERIA